MLSNRKRMRRRRRWKQKQDLQIGEFSLPFCLLRWNCQCIHLSSVIIYIIPLCSLSAMRRRKGSFKHIKFGTNIDLSDEKKWVNCCIHMTEFHSKYLVAWTINIFSSHHVDWWEKGIKRLYCHTLLLTGGNSSFRSCLNCQLLPGWCQPVTCSVT